MINNKKTVKCEKCGNKAELEVVPDDFDDAPARFTITRTCSSACQKLYISVSPQEMHDEFGLPLTGWSSGSGSV